MTRDSALVVVVMMMMVSWVVIGMQVIKTDSMKRKDANLGYYVMTEYLN